MTILAKIRRLPPMEGWDFRRELHLWSDRARLHTEPGPGRLSVIEGKSIGPFEFEREKVRYYIHEADVPVRKRSGTPASMHRHFRLAVRDISRVTDRRTLIAMIIPPHSVGADSLGVESAPHAHTSRSRLCAVALLNSFVIDYSFREGVPPTSVHTLPHLRALHIPDLDAHKGEATPIVERAAALLCTTPDYKPLASDVQVRVTKSLSTSSRSRIRAELDGLIAHFVGITESEYVRVLQSFPLVPESVRVAAHNAYRDIERGAVSD